ncbi:MAG: hypothetical protein ACI31D_01570, partial [Candidatus Limisoma sp.]
TLWMLVCSAAMIACASVRPYSADSLLLIYSLTLLAYPVAPRSTTTTDPHPRASERVGRGHFVGFPTSRRQGLSKSRPYPAARQRRLTASKMPFSSHENLHLLAF